MFKDKSNKLKYITNVHTLDELHHNYLAKLDEQKMNVPKKKEKLVDLENKLVEIESAKEFGSTNDIKLKSKLKSEIELLQGQIMNDESNGEILDYISRVGDIVIGYYSIANVYNANDNDEDTEFFDSETDLIDITEIEQSNQSAKDSDQRGIYISEKLKHLNQISQQSRKVKKPVKKRRVVQDASGSKSILNFFFTEKHIEKTEPVAQVILNKATLQDKYLMLTNKSYACDKVKIEKVIYCTNCKIEKTLFQSEGSYVCKNCGETEHIIMESEIPSHKELSNEKQKYPYKKINHLKEKLNQFQSKESADVPDNICEIVRADLRKRRINCDTCSPPDIRSILKKHKLTSYYEHLQQIYCKISGSSPISLSRDVEETVINMFQAMQESFRKHCPSNRSNFLSYSYVLNKLFKILKMDEHAKYFNLLKSKEKLREQDFIWKKICFDMQWKFHSSF